MLRPGRLRLATKPNFTGSTGDVKMIGIVSVAACGRIKGPTVARITSGRRRTSSTAASVICSRLPFAAEVDFDVDEARLGEAALEFGQ
jgi:hypothetical protein